MFKYIDNKTERSVEATVKTLATKEDLTSAISNVKDDIANVKDDVANVRREISETKADTIKWMFIFWVGQIGATMAIIMLFLKK